MAQTRREMTSMILDLNYMCERGCLARHLGRSVDPRACLLADTYTTNRNDWVWWTAACPVSGGGSGITDIPLVGRLADNRRCGLEKGVEVNGVHQFPS